MLEAAFDPVLATDDAGLVTEWNNRAVTLLGWSRDEVVGRPVAEVLASPPPVSGEAPADEEGAHPTRRFEATARHRDGLEVPVEVSIHETDYDGAVKYLWFVRDLSERKRNEEVLRQLTAHLSLATASDFFGEMVRHLAELLDVAHVLVGETVEAADTIRTIAVVSDGKLVENFEYDLYGSPCQDVLRQSTCCYPRDVHRLFPDDRVLAEMEVESYLGTPLVGASGSVLGILVILDRRPLRNELVARSALEIFASRAAAELEHQRAEEILKESERRYRYLVENSLGIICTHDLDGNFLTVNPAAMRALGYAPGDYHGRHLRDLLAPDTHEELDAYLERIRAEGIASGLMRVVTKTGQERVWSYRNVLCESAQGGRYVLGHAQDVTQLKFIQDALQRSEREYRSLVEHAIYGIYRSSPGGKFLSVNPALAEILGYDSEEELLQLDMTTDLYVDPGERERLIEEYRTSGVVSGVEVQWKRRDSDLITVRLSGRPVFDDRGALECFEMIVEDVTGQRILEAQLRQAQKMEAVGQLTGGIAHDFNNILTAVLSNAELIAAELDPGQGDLRKDVDEIRIAARRGAQMIKKLMAFSRRERLVIEMLDLAQLCRDMTHMLERLLPEHIQLQFIAEDTDVVRADRGAVEQILMNLATNARDAMPAGGILRIEVRRAWVDQSFRAMHGWGKPGSYACVIVSDTGMGMDEQTRRRIFEPFFTTKPAEQGTGLGMAMVYGLVKQHEGFISVYSEQHNGTTMRVYFPLAEQTVQSATRPSTADFLRGEGERILLAEDDEAIRRSAHRILERWGYRVVPVKDGAEALAFLQQEDAAIDLVVADLIMPRVGGRRLWELAGGTSRGLPFLFTSGYTARDLEASGELEPDLAFLHKPWTVTELLTRVRETLHKTAP